eukprot:scaffold9439_cov118-Isochrysis_galbana.AAC.1
MAHSSGIPATVVRSEDRGISPRCGRPAALLRGFGKRSAERCSTTCSNSVLNVARQLTALQHH